MFIACTVCILLSTLGAAVQSSFHAHLAMRIIKGLATGATESVITPTYLLALQA
jgi:predicted MFS family arabinose efflux permease